MQNPAATPERCDVTCARCLATLPSDAAVCPGCREPFHGAGHFQRIDGPGPSLTFQQLFGQGPRPAGRRASQ